MDDVVVVAEAVAIVDKVELVIAVVAFLVVVIVELVVVARAYSGTSQFSDEAFPFQK